MYIYIFFLRNKNLMLLFQFICFVRSYYEIKIYYYYLSCSQVRAIGLRSLSSLGDDAWRMVFKTSVGEGSSDEVIFLKILNSF